MFPSEAGAITVQAAVNTASLSAGANNGGWISTANLQGNLVFVIQVGSVTGNVVVKLQDATDGSGTGAADITGATTGTISTANSVTKLVLDARKPRSHVRAVATVTTGPVLTSVTLVARSTLAS